MRTIRALTIATAVVAAVPTISAAQHGRQFRDSWFWGIKGGGFTLADSGQAYKQTPVAGIDWLITRKRGGLYISGSQAFFTQQTFMPTNPSSPDGNFRVVDLKNLRKLDVAIVGFPGEHLRFHPYFGAGFTMAQVATAEAQPPFNTEDEFLIANAVVQDSRVSFSPMFLLGGQYAMRRLSVFGQAMASPAQKQFILYNGRPWNFTYEVGLRYNFGSSIERN